MTGIKELAYVVYQVSDLMDWEHFGVTLLGMQFGHKTPNGFSLRTDQKAYRWLIEQGPADDLVATGFEVDSDAELDLIVARLQSAGREVTVADADLIRARRVERLVSTTDPMGNRVELITGFADADTAFESRALLGGFVTGAGGAGHEVLTTPGVTRETYLEFYVDLLGMQISDTIVEKIAPGVYADLIFLHCNPRHHTVALGDVPVPRSIHHFMVEVSDIRDVGRAWDRCLAAHQPIEMTLGMHTNDRMFSFYVSSPSGFAVEFGWGGLLIDDPAAWQIGHFDMRDSWGHESPTRVAESLHAGTMKGAH